LATKVESVPIIYHLPVAFPSASPPSQGEATTNQASWTRPNQFILLPFLSQTAPHPPRLHSVPVTLAR
jgi:hypothetical protein